MFARRAGLELYFATQKIHCRDFEICSEPNKICMSGILPHITSTNKMPRKCNHLLIASEPIGEEDIWEEVPDGMMLSVDSSFYLRIHAPLSPFWVTWPPEVTKHPERENVISACV